MKLLITLTALLILTGCDTLPKIVPDTTGDNVIMMGLKDRINEPGSYTDSYGWLFWYGPVALLGLMWGWRNLIMKPLDCIDTEPDDEIEIKEETKETPK